MLELVNFSTCLLYNIQECHWTHHVFIGALRLSFPVGKASLTMTLVARFRYDRFCSHSRDFHAFAENSSPLCVFMTLRTISRIV